MNVRVRHRRVYLRGRGINKHGIAGGRLKCDPAETNLERLKSSLKALSLTGKRPKYIAL